MRRSLAICQPSNSRKIAGSDKDTSASTIMPLTFNEAVRVKDKVDYILDRYGAEVFADGGLEIYGD